MTGPDEECERATPTQYFFYRQTLNISSSIDETGGMHLGQVLCLLLAWAFTFLFILRGVKSTGKVGATSVGLSVSWVGVAWAFIPAHEAEVSMNNK